tara:strand:- start:39 stop:218 length:180 start_codon:yes stop_codon:yes gene_type:complete
LAVVTNIKNKTMELLESQKEMIKTATNIQLENILKETIVLKEQIEKEIKSRKNMVSVNK